MCELKEGRSGQNTENGERRDMKVTFGRQGTNHAEPVTPSLIIWYNLVRGAMGGHLGLLNGSATFSGIYFERPLCLCGEQVRSRGPVGYRRELEIMARVQQGGCQLILMLVWK